jgi:hypothetical protein
MTNKDELSQKVWALISKEGHPDKMTMEDYEEFLEELRDKAQDRLDALDVDSALSDKGEEEEE